MSEYRAELDAAGAACTNAAAEIDEIRAWLDDIVRADLAPTGRRSRNGVKRKEQADTHLLFAARLLREAAENFYEEE